MVKRYVVYAANCIFDAPPNSDGQYVLVADYDALAARMAEAERDAARYRYMRGVASFRDRNGPGLYWYLPRFLPGGSAEQLDASIDASITAVSADDVINAQHDETGRTWRGPRSQLPRRYFEVEAICCLDYPRCDCNSPPEPDNEWHCSQYPDCECFAGCREKALEVPL